MKKVLKIFLGVLFAALLVGTFVFLWQKTRPVKIVYAIEQPKTDTLRQYVVATGKVQPRDEVEIKPQISGIISDVYKEAGEEVRQGEVIDDDLVILINFDPASYESFRVGVPREGDWEVIFDSDRPEFGGSGYAGKEPYTCSSEPYPWNGQMDSIEIKVPGLAGVVLKRRGPSSYKPPVVEEPKKATRKRTSSVMPKPAAAKKAPAKAKAKTATKTKSAAKPAAKATAAKKSAAKKAATKAKSASVKPAAKDA